MDVQSTSIVWSFPGGTPLFMAGCLVGICILLIFSFRLRKARIDKEKRSVLTLLRLLLIALILLCLANPIKVTELLDENSVPSRVAAIVDTSGSMRLPSVDGNSRLDNSIRALVRLYRGLNDDATIDIFRLDESMYGINDISGLKELPSEPVASQLNKHLLNLKRYMDFERYSQVLVFTDGINTGDSRLESHPHDAPKVMKLILADAELKPDPSGRLFRIEHANRGQVGMETSIHLSYELRHHHNASPFQILLKDEEGQTEYEASIETDAAYSRTFGQDEIRFLIEDTGWRNLKLELRAPDGSTVFDSARIAIEGVELSPLKILVVQGYSDTNLTSLRHALTQKERYELSFRFWDDSWVGYGEKNMSARLSEHYDAIILLNVATHRALDGEAERLISFVREGGALFSLIPDPVTAAAILNSGVQPLFPMIPARRQSPHRSGNLIFDPTNGRIRVGAGGSPSTPFTEFETYFQLHRQGKAKSELRPFHPTPEGLASGIFGTALEKPDSLPGFVNLTSIDRLQPAAQLLSTAGPARQGALLASQLFGRGQVVQMSTGSLWEWQGALDTDSSSYEQFWRNLIAYGTRHLIASNEWEIIPFTENERSLIRTTFKLAQSSNNEADYEFFLELAGQKSRFTPQRNAQGNFTAELELPKFATYKLVAEDPDGRESVAYFDHRENTQPDEYLRLEADRANAEYIASHAGYGQVISLSAVDDLAYVDSALRLPEIKVIRTSLWNTRWVILAMLLIFCTELILRRVWKTI